MNDFEKIFNEELSRAMRAELAKISKIKTPPGLLNCKLSIDTPVSSSIYSEKDYYKLEYKVRTKITDRDMLPFQINAALDSGNKDLFIKLTQQLKEA